MTANGDPVCTYCGTQFVDPDKKTIGLVPGGFNPYAQAQQQNSYSQLSGNFQHPGFSSGGLASIAGAIGLLGILHGR
jgi:hypothetical protein